MESGSLQHVPRFPRPYPSDFSAAWVGGRSSSILLSLGTGTRRCRSLLGLSPGGRRRRRQRPENPESLNGGANSTYGEGAAVSAAISFPSLFPGLCSSAVTLPGEETEKARERPPKATPGELSSWDRDPLDPTPLYPPFPSPGSQPRTAAPSRAPGFCCVCWCRAAGGVCNKGTDKKPGCQIRMHLLPLDRRTIFSRNVFCGATSPFLPPAMVILPAARGLGGVPARRLTAASSWARGPRAIPAGSAPCAPRGPGRAGAAAAPSGCHPRALFAPPSPLPASLCTRAGLAAPQPPPGGRGGAAATGPAAPPTGPVSPAGLRETERGAPAAAGKPSAAAG